MRSLRILTPMVALLGFVLAGLARAETFDLQAYVYCPPGTYCGHGSVQALRDTYMQHVAEMNLEFQPSGVSFHPLEPVITQDNRFSTISGDEGKAGNGEQNSDLLKELWQTHAEPHPERVTMFLLPGLPKCWNGIPCPGDGQDHFNGDDVIFCAPPAGNLGRVYAHEMGHNFCLRHTFTGADPSTATEQVDHNGDDNINPACTTLTNVPDTPPDPLIKEGSDTDDNGNDLEHHEWCAPQKHLGVDPGSPHDSFCSTDCFRVTDGTPQLTGFLPMSRNSMSYYSSSSCRGPYVLNGVRFEAITPGQADQIRECLTAVPVRTQLVDVCAGKGGDSDLDGHCDDLDACPMHPNTHIVDSDGDQIPDACDLCPYAADSTNTDTDLDGIGDVCDEDDDNDGCLDASDQHPKQSSIEVGTFVHRDCDASDVSEEPLFVFEGMDSDGDGLPNCADDDDDNDDILDDDDDCPVHAGGCSFAVTQCPLIPIWAECLLGGCVEHELLVTLVNPDPSQSVTVRFDDISIEGNTIWIAPSPGQAASEAASVIAGHPSGTTAKSLSPTAKSHNPWEPVRVEVDLIDPFGDVTAIGEHEPGEPQFDDTDRGVLVGLTPAGESTPMVLELGWSVGAGTGFADTDNDKWPDFRDNCNRRANAKQRDTDGDGVGDACDADFDQNGRVERNDLAMLEECHGVDLTIQHIKDMNDGAETTPSPSEANDYDSAVRQHNCAVMDLNDDGIISERDSALAEDFLGRAPGPSSPVAYDWLFVDGFGRSP